MKKFLLFFLVLTFTFDFADAQMVFNGGHRTNALPGLSQNDDFADVLKKRRKKKRRKSSKKRGRSSSTTMAVGPGLFVAMPMGDFADAVKTGMGFNVDGEYFISPMLSLGANTGNYAFKYDVADDSLTKFNKSKFSVTPLCVKASYYFMDDVFRPYAGVNVGMFINKSVLNFDDRAIIFNQVTSKNDTVWLTTEMTDITTDFGIAPMLGATYDFSEKLALNINARYDMIFTEEKNTTFLGFNFGLLYKF